MIEYTYLCLLVLYYKWLLKLIFYGDQKRVNPREFWSLTSRVCISDDELNKDFESYKAGVFNGQRSARGSAGLIE